MRSNVKVFTESLDVAVIRDIEKGGISLFISTMRWKSDNFKGIIIDHKDNQYKLKFKTNYSWSIIINDNHISIQKDMEEATQSLRSIINADTK